MPSWLHDARDLQDSPRRSPDHTPRDRIECFRAAELNRNADPGGPWRGRIETGVQRWFQTSDITGSEAGR